jgi:O-antigen/teichoic acid export membrane protein
VASIILSAVFTPDDYGVYGIVIQIIAILVFFSDIGLAAALIQKKEQPTERDYTTAFTLQQVLSWLIFLITVGIALSGILSAKTGLVGNWILISLGLSFPLASLKTIPSIILERKLEFSRMVIPQIAEQAVFYMILITGALMGYGVFSYIPAILIRSVTGLLIMFVLQWWPIKVGIYKDSLKSMIGFGVKFQLNDLLARIKDQLFFLMLGYYFPLAQFGFINWAKQWSSYPYNLTVQNVMSITFPVFSRLQHDTNLLKKAIEKTLFFISLGIFPILAGMCIFIFPLLEVFPAYAKWQPAAWSLIFFALSIVGGALSTPITNTLNAIGKISVTLKLMVMWTILTWVVTPIAIYFYGYNGVAFAALLISFTSFLPIIYIKRIVPIAIMDQIWRQGLAAGGMVVVGVLGQSYWSNSVTSLVVGMLSSAVIYGLILVLIGKDKLFSEFRSLKISKA